MTKRKTTKNMNLTRSGEMIEITWRDFKRMIFWGRKMYLPSIRLNQWVQQDLNWMTSYTVQFISNWHPFSHLQARNKLEPRIIRELLTIKSECKSRRVIEMGFTKARCIKANGNRQHAADVTGTAWRRFFDKLFPPSRFNNHPLIPYQVLLESFNHISIRCSKFKIHFHCLHKMESSNAANHHACISLTVRLSQIPIIVVHGENFPWDSSFTSFHKFG
jgi:hypothetical protein